MSRRMTAFVGAQLLFGEAAGHTEMVLLVQIYKQSRV